MQSRYYNSSIGPNGLRQTVTIDESSQDHIWMNVELTNTTSNPIPAKFNFQRTQPILMDPSKYNVSVTNFSIPTSNIPLLQNPDANNQSNYYVCIGYAGAFYPSQVTYIAQTSNADLTDLGNVYTIGNMVRSINNALASAYTVFITANPGVTPAAPFFLFDSKTQRYALVADDTYYSADVAVYFSGPLYYRFQGFDVFYNGYGLASKDDVEIEIYPMGTPPFNTYFPPGDSGSSTLLIMWQEAPNPNQISDIQKIVITSSLIPVERQIDLSFTSQYNSNNNVTAILATWIPEKIPTNQISGSQNATYTAKVFKLFPMNSNSPLYMVDLNLNYLGPAYDTQVINGVPTVVLLSNNLNDIFIEAGETVRITIGFIKKGLMS